MKVKETGVFDAKTRLSGILDEVESGTTYYITKRGRKVAELRPIQGVREKPAFGYAKGTIKRISEDFDKPLEDMKDYME